MDTAAAFLILAAALAILAGAVRIGMVVARSRLLPAPSLVTHAVLIQTTKPDELAIRGVVIAAHPDRWTLTEVFYVYSDRQEPVAGTVHIPAERIAYIQELAPPAL